MTCRTKFALSMYPKLIDRNYFSYQCLIYNKFRSYGKQGTDDYSSFSLPSETIKKKPDGFFTSIHSFEFILFCVSLFEFQLCESWSNERVTRQPLDVWAPSVNVCANECVHCCFCFLFLLLLLKCITQFESLCFARAFSSLYCRYGV